MWKIGNMLWRIGELLDFDQQLVWTRDAGFDGVGFHASTGAPGKWSGIEPATCDATRRACLRQEIGRFAFAEIHAPFAIDLQTETLSASMTALAPVLDLAKDLSVGVVTVHAQPPRSDTSPDMTQWLAPMQALEQRLSRVGTTVVLEIVDGFDAVKRWNLPRVRVNLDVGHMYASANTHVLDRYNGIGNLIRHIGPALAHLHMHDVAADGQLDHIEIGTGIVDFDEITSALRDIAYRGNMTLELNPDRVSPEGIRRSADYLRACFRGTITP